MKKLLTVLAALVIAASAHAQFGIIAGVTSPSQEVKQAYENFSAINQYHAGITVKIPLPLGFAIQPSVIYNVQGQTIQDFTEGSAEPETAFAKNGYIQVPVQVQWGFGIAGVVRLYAVAEPFVGYLVDENTFDIKDGKDLEKKDWQFEQKLNYGVGAGLGIEVLNHVQLSARYVWNMGNLLGPDGKVNVKGEDVVETVKTGLQEGTNNGIRVSLAFLF